MLIIGDFTPVRGNKVNLLTATWSCQWS